MRSARYVVGIQVLTMYLNAAVRSAWCVVRSWKTGTYDDYQVHLMGEQRDQTQCLVENHVHRTAYTTLRFLGSKSTVRVDKVSCNYEI